ncbi:MAG: hypothetical protein SFY81_15990 [Verrucomicrobiota bacterium]|nr:hypothetical protein [Verrucomicrobiota bacterium]
MEPEATDWPDELFNQLAVELFALQFRFNPAYRKFCEARRIEEKDVSEWRAIPAVPAVAFKLSEMTSIEERDRNRCFFSSGTSQQERSRHYHSSVSLGIYECALRHHFERSVIPFEQLKEYELVFLTPRPEETPNSSLNYMFGQFSLHSKVACFFGKIEANGGWGLDMEGLRMWLTERGPMGRPVFLFGTAFNYVQLLGGSGRNGKKWLLPKGSKVLETGGYKGRVREVGKGELYGAIAASLGLAVSSIYSEYGMSELSSQAYDSDSLHKAPEERRFRFPGWVRVQVISPETGRAVRDGDQGLIQVHDLANVFSAGALLTGDLGVIEGEYFRLSGRAESMLPKGCSLFAEEDKFQ